MATRQTEWRRSLSEERLAEFKRRDAERARKYRAQKRAKAIAEGSIIPRTPLSKEEKRERQRVAMRKWRAENPERARAASRKSSKTFRAKNGKKAQIDNQALKALRHALWTGCGDSKFFPGYAGADVQARILNTMPEGQSLLSYGLEWEIDHIEPLSSFQYDSVEDEEYKRAWALSNIRACSVFENRSKGAS
jgi:hypothetical protein